MLLSLANQIKCRDCPCFSSLIDCDCRVYGLIQLISLSLSSSLSSSSPLLSLPLLSSSSLFLFSFPLLFSSSSLFLFFPFSSLFVFLLHLNSHFVLFPQAVAKRPKEITITNSSRDFVRKISSNPPSNLVGRKTSKLSMPSSLTMDTVCYGLSLSHSRSRAPSLALSHSRARARSLSFIRCILLSLFHSLTHSVTLSCALFYSIFHLLSLSLALSFTRSLFHSLSLKDSFGSLSPWLTRSLAVRTHARTHARTFMFSDHLRNLLA